MTTESTQPQTELGPAPANGQGQSQGHRRRRRRRKNKNSQQSRAASAAGPDPAPGPTLQAKPSRSPAPRPGKPQHQQHQGQGHRRRRRNSSRRAPAPAAQPGNSTSCAVPQGKRKGRQKGPREFVGPMDHSYRAVNGNMSDGPPSTIQIMSNGHNGSYYQDAYAPQPAVRSAGRRPHAHLLLHRRSVLPGQDSGDGAKLGVKVEFVKGGQGFRGQADRSAGCRAAHAAGLRPEQPERQAA